jgi:hypothetical protein
MKQKAEHQTRRLRAKLPPILEIDEDGIPLHEMSTFEGRRWTSDAEDSDFGVQLGDWPGDLDH